MNTYNELISFWVGCFVLFSLGLTVFLFCFLGLFELTIKIREKFNKFVFRMLADYFDGVKVELRGVSPEVDYFIDVMSKSLRAIKRPYTSELRDKLESIKNGEVNE